MCHRSNLYFCNISTESVRFTDIVFNGIEYLMLIFIKENEHMKNRKHTKFKRKNRNRINQILFCKAYYIWLTLNQLHKFIKCFCLHNYFQQAYSMLGFFFAFLIMLSLMCSTIKSVYSILWVEMKINTCLRIENHLIIMKTNLSCIMWFCLFFLFIYRISNQLPFQWKTMENSLLVILTLFWMYVFASDFVVNFMCFS